MPRPRLVAVGVVVAGVLAAAACSNGGGTLDGVQSHPEVGWVNGTPAPALNKPMPGPDTPNIVYILTDDLTWDLLKYMPQVLAMQRAGTTFTNYFVTDSLCCPSRTSIFTGMFPHNSGVFTNNGVDGGFRAYLAHQDQNKSFAGDLQARGYLTGFFGKFLNLYHPQTLYNGQRPYVAPGWSAWAAQGTTGYNEFDYVSAVGRSLAHFGSQPTDYLTHVLAEKASRFISTSVRARRPFMTEVATFAPHQPVVPAPQDAGKFPNLKAPEGPAFGRGVQNAPRWLASIPPLTPTDRDRMSHLFRRRAQAVLAVDRMVGELRAEVQRLGIADNTYFVFNSDNGFHIGQYNLRAGKETAFDTDINVPLVVTGPGVTAGSIVTKLTQNIDLAPTFEDLAGATPPATVDGHSLVPLLHGQPTPDWRNAVLVEHHGPTTNAADPDVPSPLSGNPPSYEAIRTSRYLYVEYVDGEHEYYDLATDPFELRNLYRTLPEPVRSRLHSTLLRMSTCHGGTDCWNAQHITR